MAPPAKSRKGKKAWRKNIDTSEVEAFLEEKTYQERRGPAAKELKDDQLFFVDTTADVEGATAVAEGKRPAKRRREEAAAKPLRSELIIAEAHKAKPLKLAPPPRKPTSAAAAAGAAGAAGAAAAGAGKSSKRAVVTATAGQNGKRRHGQGAGSHPLDLWGDEDLVNPDLDLGAKAAPGPGSAALLAAAAAAAAGTGAGRNGSGKKARKAADKAAAVEPELAAATAAVRAMGPTARPLRRGKSPPAAAATQPPPPRVKAVAVDIPGCSFNPDAEHHQDALALLVAAELRKELRRELLPSAPPEEVEAPEGRPLSELEALQVDAASSDEEEEDDDAAQDPNAIPLAGEDDGDGGDEDGGDELDDGKSGKKNKALEKKSRKDRNKEARRKAAEAEAVERRRLKAQRRELQSLTDVQAALEEEQREKEIRRLRRAAMLEERAATLPPRLGKLRFEPPSVQVLTSDEKTGSLRQVVPCAMLAADRFKSLQQRGLVEPRKPQPFKEKRRKVTYEKGARFEKAAEASAQVRELTHRNKKARRQAKTAAARAGGEDDWL